MATADPPHVVPVHFVTVSPRESQAALRAIVDARVQLAVDPDDGEVWSAIRRAARVLVTARRPDPAAGYSEEFFCHVKLAQRGDFCALAAQDQDLSFLDSILDTVVHSYRPLPPKGEARIAIPAPERFSVAIARYAREIGAERTSVTRMTAPSG